MTDRLQMKQRPIRTMSDDKRSDIINQLALAAGAPTKEMRMERQRFDSETGTLYLNGALFQKGVIEDAKSYLFGMMQQCNNSEVQATKKLAMYYRLALEGIRALTEE